MAKDAQLRSVMHELRIAHARRDIGRMLDDALERARARRSAREKLNLALERVRHRRTSLDELDDALWHAHNRRHLEEAEPTADDDDGLDPDRAYDARRNGDTA